MEKNLKTTLKSLYSYRLRSIDLLEGKYLKLILLSLIIQLLMNIHLLPIWNIGRNNIDILWGTLEAESFVRLQLLLKTNGISIYIQILLITLFIYSIGFSVLVSMKYYLYKQSTLKEGLMFVGKKFGKIFLYKFIQTFLVSIVLICFIIPGIIIYSRLINIDYLFMDDPDLSLKELFKKSWNKKYVDIIIGLCLNTPVFILFYLFTIIKSLILARNLLDGPFFSWWNLGCYGVYFMIIPLLIAYVQAMVENNN